MKKFLVIGLPLFVVLSISIFFRSYPVFFPQYRDLADKRVDQRVQQTIAQEINKTYPSLSDLAKSKIFDVAVTDYEKNNKKVLKEQKKEEFSRLIDRFQDKYGQTYLMELDGWHWGRYIRNIDRLGQVGDEIKDGEQHDKLMFFPQGTDLNWSTLFFYTSWALYKVFTLFHPVALSHFLFYLPLFFISILIILLYFFCYRHWGGLVAFICCVFVSVGPILLPRSSAGWFDFDTLSMIYPFLIVWTYILSYNSSSWRRSIGWVILAAFWLSLFCATWIGWPFILFIIIFYEIIVMANSVSEQLQYKEDRSKEIKKHLVILATFIFFGVFWIVLFSGFSPLESLINQAKNAVSLNNPLASLMWPNVLSTVGELKVGDYLSIAKAVGGVFSLILVLLIMLAIFLNIKRYEGIKREFLLIFVVWFMTMFFFCSKGIRFTMYLLVPIGLFLGWGFEEGYRFLLKKKWKLGIIPLAMALVGLIVSLMFNADNTAKGMLPLMDDAWYSALTSIKKYTPEDSVINSWWDFGDWFKAVGERRVIFDGQTQNSPQAYWMGRVLLTDSEEEAIGILRMLNNGGNTAFEIIDKKVANPFLSISLLKRAILLTPEEGISFLSQYLPPQECEKVAHILYSRPKQNAYFVVDSSMIGKINPISYLGNWDFNKVYLRHLIRSKPKEQILQDLINFGLDLPTAEKYYQEASLISGTEFQTWVSRRSLITSISYQSKNPDNLVLFNNGYIYDLKKKTIFSYSSYEERYRVPKSLFLFDGKVITEEQFPQADSDNSALILEDKHMYKLILLSRELGRSVFVKLQFFNGKGLAHFAPFIREGEEQNRILVYEIKWD